MQDLLAIICSYLEKKQAIAIATIIHNAGSTPRGAGSKLLANEKGLIFGTVGGGLSEAQTINACIQALANKQARIMHFNLSGELAAKSSMICGGDLDVLIEVILPSKKNLSFYKKLAKLAQNNQVILCANLTNINNIQRELILENESEFLELAKKDCYIMQKDSREYFIELYQPKDKMLIIGAGHVSLAIYKFAILLGFEVIVLDDRIEFANKERFSEAQTIIVPKYKNCFKNITINSNTYIVIVTRGHLYDRVVLEQALKTQAKYIGMIGSRHKKAEVFEALLTNGFTQKDLNRVCSPIGLEINAETPEEIAVSILAECIQYKRSKN